MNNRVTRGRVALAVLFLSTLAAGAAVGHILGAFILLAAVATAWGCAGFPAVFTVCVAVLALGSSSVLDLKDPALDLRWLALAMLAAWPAVSGRRPALLVPKAFAIGAAVLVVLGAASAIWSIDPPLTLARAAAFATLLWVALIVLPVHTGTHHERRALARWLARLCVTGAVVALVLALAWPDLARPFGPMRGWLENSNTMGLWCALLAPSLLAIRSRRLIAVASVPVALTIVLSQSRSALLIIALFAFTIAPLSLRARLAIAAALVATLTLLLVTPASSLLADTALDKFGGDNFTRSLTGARNEAWSGTLELVPVAPVEGFGFGTAAQAFERTGIQDDFLYFQGANPNNGYLNTLLEQGLAGLIILLVTFGAAVRMLPSRMKLADRRPYVLAAIGTLATGIVESIFTSPGSPFTILVWVSLALAISSNPARVRPARPRVLVHAAALKPAQNGSRTVLSRLIKELPGAWPDADIVVSVTSDSPLEHANGLDVQYLGSRKRASSRLICDYALLPPLVNRLSPDVVISPNESVPSRIDAKLLVVAQNLVYHCAQVTPQRLGSRLSRLRSRLQFAFYRSQMPRTYDRADAVVAVSQTTARVLAEEAGLDPARTHVVPEGADCLPVLPRDGTAQTRRRLLIVGTSAPYKRSEVAIAALGKLNHANEGKNYELMLVGGEWPEHGSTLDRLAADHGVADYYCRTSGVGPSQLAKLYATSHALVALSSCESFGLPVVEAMRAGLPVIVADEPWSREVAGAVGLYVDGSDPDSVARGVRQVDNPREWESRSQAGRAAVARLSWRATAEGLAQVAGSLHTSESPTESL